MEFKALKLEIKAAAADGTFEGVASKYGVEDAYGDVIEKGAFTKTIKDGNPFPVLWQHRAADVIGDGSVSETGGDIVIKGQMDMEDPVAKKAIAKMKKGLIRGLSIGFTTVRATFEEIKDQRKWIRHIHELKLWEVSVVTFPALSGAQVTAVKSARNEQFQALQAPGTSDSDAAAADGAAAQTTEPGNHSEILGLEVPQWS